MISNIYCKREQSALFEPPPHPCPAVVGAILAIALWQHEIQGKHKVPPYGIIIHASCLIPRYGIFYVSFSTMSVNFIFDRHSQFFQRVRLFDIASGAETLGFMNLFRC